MMRFVERNGEICRVLMRNVDGIWLISHQAPAAPFVVSPEEFCDWNRIPMPDTYRLSAKLTSSQEARLRLIQPLLEDSRCITDKPYRLSIAKEIAEREGTTPRRLLRMYYRYLATGTLTEQKGRIPQSNPDYDWAIRTFYFSAKKLSLRAAYDMMLVQRYTDVNGCLQLKVPSWSSFQHYFYSRNYHKQPQKAISREGLTYYQRNLRPAFGSASGWRESAGSYQMDATQADIYLVSRFDRSTVVGRPYIYMAVDTATQLIAGIYVGFACDESAVMACLAQAAGGKVEYCGKFGIKITPDQWPSTGIPAEIITDKGREFLGGRMEELCQRYGMEVQSLPPFRPDRKGLVEKTFDLMQQRYKPLLRGKGIIEADAQERWATDYRKQAVLDLHEYTQVIIHTVIYLNSGRILVNGKTPAQQWMDSAPNLLDVPPEELRLQTLPREIVKLSRKGFHLNKLWYAPTEMDGLFLGDTYPLAYDPADLSTAYVVLSDGFRPCPLTSNCADYRGLTAAEGAAIHLKEQAGKKESRKREMEVSAATVRAIQEVVRKATGVSTSKQTGAIIQENQKAERSRLT